MSGSKSFGVRSPPDPPKLQRAEPVTPATPVPPVSPDACPSKPYSDSGAGVCVERATVAEVVPRQLQDPFPEPPLPAVPPRKPGSGLTLGDVAASIPLRDPDEAFLLHEMPAMAEPGCAPAPAADFEGPGLPHTATAAVGERGAWKEAFPSVNDAGDPCVAALPELHACPSQRPCPVSMDGGMYNFDPNDDRHPYIKILETPAPPRPLLTKHFQSLSWAGIGIGSACAYNAFGRKPIFSGIQRHAAMAAGGWILGVYLQKWISSSMAETDAILKHYIELHPEDFPMPVRKKYSELFLPWARLR